MGIIKIEGLTKIYRVGFWRKKKIGLNSLNLEVEKGESFGYLGPNGAGKTTTLKIILGLIRPTNGSVTILDKPIDDVSLKHHIGFLPEQPYFYDYLTGGELLEFYAHFFGLSRSERTKRIGMLLDMVSLTGSEGIALRKYSKGMLQRIGIAQALINDPDIVFLDEPLSGLDPIGRKEVRDIISVLKEGKKTIFFSSHVLPDVEMICDRIAILNKGHLVAVGAIDNLLLVKANRIDIEFMGGTVEGKDKIRDKVVKWVEQDQRTRITIEGEDKVMEFINMINTSGGVILSVMPHRKSLEELFVEKLGIDSGGRE